jgi:hypothetical protein
VKLHAHAACGCKACVTRTLADQTSLMVFSVSRFAQCRLRIFERDIRTPSMGSLTRCRICVRRVDQITQHYMQSALLSFRGAVHLAIVVQQLGYSRAAAHADEVLLPRRIILHQSYVKKSIRFMLDWCNACYAAVVPQLQ